MCLLCILCGVVVKVCSNLLEYRPFVNFISRRNTYFIYNLLRLRPPPPTIPPPLKALLV